MLARVRARSKPPAAGQGGEHKHGCRPWIDEALLCNEFGEERCKIVLKEFPLALDKGVGKHEQQFWHLCTCCFWIGCGQQPGKFMGKQDSVASGGQPLFLDNS